MTEREQELEKKVKELEGQFELWGKRLCQLEIENARLKCELIGHGT